MGSKKKNYKGGTFDVQRMKKNTDNEIYSLCGFVSVRVCACVCACVVDFKFIFIGSDY